MGLLDLQTDLKTLKYGNRSLTSFPFQEPFVTVDIPATNEPLPVYPINIQTNAGQIIATAFRNNLINLGNSFIPGPGAPTQKPPKLEFTIKGPQAGTGGPDFLLRGGLLFPTIVARDVLRITKTLASTNGLLFVAKQKILQATGLKPEYLQNVSVGNKLLNLVIGRDQYNPANTLAQVGVVGLGGHLPRDGRASNLLDLKLGSVKGGDFEPGKYITYVNGQKGVNLPFKPVVPTVSGNRLLRFYEVNQVRLTNLLNASPEAIVDPNFLYRSIGGPNSLLGIGTTTVRTAATRTGLGNQMVANDPDAGKNQLNPYLTYTQTDIYNTTPVGRGGKLQDFRKVLRDSNPGFFARTDYASKIQTTAQSVSYTVDNIENAYLLGDPGDKSKFNEAGTSDYRDYTVLKDYPTDLINSRGWFDVGDFDERVDNDLVLFTIEGVDLTSPINSQVLQFRAFLGNISDSYTAEWSNQRYVGRAEKFYTYQGFDRTLSLSWVVAAQSYGEMRGMYNKLQQLASYTAPDYGSYGYMKAPIVRLTIGKLYYRLPGIITNISFEINNETPWEVGYFDNNGNRVYGDDLNHPHVIQVSSFNFIPIHEITPEYKTYFGQIS